MFTDIASVFGRGEAYMMISVTSWAVYTVVGQKALSGLSPLTVTTYAALVGAILLNIALVLQPQGSLVYQVDGSFLVNTVYLALFGTVIAFIWFYEGISKIGSSKSAVFTNLVPVFGVLLSVIILGETIDYSMLVGGALAVFGIFLTNTSGSRKIENISS